MRIDGLKIIDFKGLHNFPALDFNRMNIIASPGNFGKTSLLQAIYTVFSFDRGDRILKTAGVFKPSEYSEFDFFKYLLYNKNKVYTYNIEAKISGFSVTKKLTGEFNKENTEFKGEYFSSAVNDSVSIDYEICENINFSKEDNKYLKRTYLLESEVAYFDFERNETVSVSDYKNINIKGHMENNIRAFDERITDIIIKNGTVYTESHKSAIFPARFLGSGLYKQILFSHFIDKNGNADVIFIENPDMICTGESMDIYIRTLISFIFEINAQVFITVRNRCFAEKLFQIMEENNCSDKVNYINIYKESGKPDSEIKVSLKAGKYKRFHEIFGLR